MQWCLKSELHLSHVSVVVSLCLAPAIVPQGATSFDDVAKLPHDKSNFLYAASRNGWLNQCLCELVKTFALTALPVTERPFLMLAAHSLTEPINALRKLLELFARDPQRLPEFARWQATEASLAYAARECPESFALALAEFNRVNADDEGNDVPTVIAFLWCQLRLMQHATDNRLCFLTSEV